MTAIPGPAPTVPISSMEHDVVLHGNALHYLDTGPGGRSRAGRGSRPAGDGREVGAGRGAGASRGADRPVVLFVHGILGSHRNWTELLDGMAHSARVIAPDLFGHGGSAKPMGDYSLGAHAGALRDLLDELGIGRVTMVGHSLGGGVAMQFAYLFPERVERLVLVSSGGLGRELSVLLRAAVLPGSELVLPALAWSWIHERGHQVGRAWRRLGLPARPDLAEAWRGIGSLSNGDSRRAFLATARAVIDVGGQTVYAGNRFALIGGTPTLIVWGARDPIIPYQHGVAAHREISHSRLELFEGAGHFPHLDDPERFARVLREFIAGTVPVTARAPVEESANPGLAN